MNTKNWPYPKLIAHRGAGKFAPENTLAAMRCGADHGFEMFEFDAKLSKDNHVVLLHDDDVDRTSNGKGKAAQKTYLELLSLDFGSWHSAYYAGESIPSLASIASYTIENGLYCNVEIKPCPGREEETGTLVARAVKTLWKDADLPVLLSSFEEKTLRAAQAEAPEIARAYLCEALPENYMQVFKELGCVAVNLDDKIVTKPLIDEFHQENIRVCVWTVNDYRRAKELFSWGCDAIITDEMERLSPLSMGLTQYV
ncbi:membrane protein [Basilea psittacipulmonis DSM 24701]|uniref:Membrane protein n=2 Tax=Basilea TaxID=1472344 RepID=A0A077DCI8_9BURK|nr:glycerophosphodiester phosphodiesterase [Basilea psittacipulmonis]AIL32600.1 membrane protein [Basilea psittacipulmonis DSM 24701]